MPDNNQKRGLTADEKSQFDALKSAADFWWERFDKRVTYIWRVSISLWTVLVGYIGIIISGKFAGFGATSSCLTIVIVVVAGILLFFLHLLYIINAGKAHKCDRDKFHTYEKKYMELIKVQYDPELEKLSDDKKSKQASWSQPFHLFILLITVVLISIAIFVSFSSSIAKSHTKNIDKLGSEQQQLED